MTNRTLVVMRHAKSSWETDDADIDRPLSARGRRDALAAAEVLRTRVPELDVVLVSPAARAQQTWAGIHQAGVTAGDVRTVDAIYHRDADAIVAAMRTLDPEVRTALVIGHCPTIPETVELVAARATTKQWFTLDTKFPTAGMAFVEFDGDWSAVGDATGTLTAFEVPRG